MAANIPVFILRKCSRDQSLKKHFRKKNFNKIELKEENIYIAVIKFEITADLLFSS